MNINIINVYKAKKAQLAMKNIIANVGYPTDILILKLIKIHTYCKMMINCSFNIYI